MSKLLYFVIFSFFTPNSSLYKYEKNVVHPIYLKPKPVIWENLAEQLAGVRLKNSQKNWARQKIVFNKIAIYW